MTQIGTQQSSMAIRVEFLILFHPPLSLYSSISSLSIFLVDHAWTYQPHKAREQLLSIPGLAERMAQLMGLLGTPTPPEGSEGGSYDADSESGRPLAVMDLLVVIDPDGRYCTLEMS